MEHNDTPRPSWKRSIFTASTVVATLTLAACSGSSPKVAASSGGGGSGSARGNATASVAAFCRDYRAAIDASQLANGDASDPNVATMISYFTKAQREAPVAVKGDVTTMLNFAKKVKALKGDQNYSVDLTAPSSRISAWGDRNCSGSSSTSDNSTSAAPTTAPAGTAPTDSGSGSGTSSADDTSWCSILTSTVNAISDETGPTSQTLPSTATVRQWEATVKNLDHNIPESETDGQSSLDELSRDLTAVVNGSQSISDRLFQDTVLVNDSVSC